MLYQITDKGLEKLFSFYDIKTPSILTKAYIALLEHIEEKKGQAGLLGMTKVWREALGFTPTDMRVHPMGDKQLHHTITSLALSDYIIRLDPYTRRLIPK